jgi:hypothetical protein
MLTPAVTKSFSLATVISPSDAGENCRLMFNSLLLQEENLDEYFFIINGDVSVDTLNLLNAFKLKMDADVICHQNKKTESFSDCLNFILNKSNCDVIVRIDPDDIALRNRFRKIKMVFNQESPDVYFSNAIFYNQGMFWLDKRVFFQSSKEAMSKIYFYNPFIHSTSAFSRQHILNYGSYPNVKLAEDYYLWRTLSRNKSYFYFENDSLLLFNHKGVLARRSKLGIIKSEFQLLLDVLRYKDSCVIKLIFFSLIRIFYLFSPMVIKIIISKNSMLPVKGNSTYASYLNSLYQGPLV